MIRVRNGQLQWVAEDGCGLCKIDTMLLDIRSLFIRIPLEFHDDANAFGLISGVIHSKKQSKERARLFAIRVHVIVKGFTCSHRS